MIHLTIPADEFCTPLRPGQRLLQWTQRTRHNGEAGPYLPETLQRNLPAGEVVEIHTVVPPGCGACGWYVQASSLTATFSVDGAEPTGDPRAFNTAPAPYPRGVTLRIHLDKPHLLMAIALTWEVERPEVYTAWLRGELPEPVEPAESVEQRTLRRAQESGLVAALQRHTGMPDDQLVAWAQTSGLWSALVALEVQR